MAEQIAVIGNEDSIGYFRFLGCRTYETHDGELSEQQYLEIIERKYRIIFVTEEVFRRYRDMIGKRARRLFPVICVIPDVHGAVWENERPRPGGVAFEEMRTAVVKAVGQDISGTER